MTPTSHPDIIFLGLKVAEWVNLIGLVLGPVMAVGITLWIDGRRRTREQKIVVLRLLLATRHMPSDPNFGTAINLVRVEFAKSKAVQAAHKEFLQAANAPSTPETAQAVGINTATKTTRLVFEIAKDLGFAIRETDIQADGYTSSGWTGRDALLQDSQRAMRDIATLLRLQARQIAGSTLSEDERAVLGIAPPPGVD